jgi:hypothetical protein
MAKPKPSPVPKSPALVRGRALAVALGVGLGGLACGGIETGGGGGGGGNPPQPLPPQPDGGDDGGDDAMNLDVISPQPAPVPDAELDAVAFPDSSIHDAKADTVILVPPHP